MRHSSDVPALCSYDGLLIHRYANYWTKRHVFCPCLNTISKEGRQRFPLSSCIFRLFVYFFESIKFHTLVSPILQRFKRRNYKLPNNLYCKCTWNPYTLHPDRVGQKSFTWSNPNRLKLTLKRSTVWLHPPKTPQRASKYNRNCIYVIPNLLIVLCFFKACSRWKTYSWFSIQCLLGGIPLIVNFWLSHILSLSAKEFCFYNLNRRHAFNERYFLLSGSKIAETLRENTKCFYKVNTLNSFKYLLWGQVHIKMATRICLFTKSWLPSQEFVCLIPIVQLESETLRKHAIVAGLWTTQKLLCIYNQP